MFHRFTIGDIPAMMISDGPLRLARPHRIFQGVDPRIKRKATRDNMKKLYRIA